MKNRIICGLILILAIICAALFLPPIGILFLLLAVCCLAQIEFHALLDAIHIPHFRYISLMSGAALILVTWFSLDQNTTFPPFEGELFVLFLITMLVVMRLFPQKHNPEPLATVAATFLGIMYVPFLFNFFTKLLMTWGIKCGIPVVAYLLLIVKTTDMGAYFIGRKFGRHKLFPRISPAKTWEGFFGGIATGIAASLICYYFIRPRLGTLNFELIDAITLGTLLSLTGTCGDLAESMLKRAAKIKDSGWLVSSMGGILDVIDSLLFAAPVLYYYAHFFLERT